jgi:citrate lyase beta subunit
VIDVVERSGERLDAIVLPKVTGPDHIVWLDLLLAQIEQDRGLPLGKIAIEAQIEDAAGLAAVDDIAAASDRLTALIFGPADFSQPRDAVADDRRPARWLRGRRCVPLPVDAAPGRRASGRPAGDRRAIRGDRRP